MDEKDSEQEEQKDESILVKIHNKKVAIVQINRPDRKNALNYVSLIKLDEIIDELALNRRIRVVILTGTGDSFCSGNDIKVIMGPEQVLNAQRIGRELSYKLMYMPQITIAALNGFVMGGGFEIMLGCDFKIAHSSAQFAMPEAKHGYPIGWSGLNLLPKIVGLNAAKEILLMAETFNAEKALHFGLINKIFYPDNERSGHENRIPLYSPFMKYVLDFAREYVRRDSSFTQIVKYSCNRVVEDSLSKMALISDKMFKIRFSKDKKQYLSEFRENSLRKLLMKK